MRLEKITHGYTCSTVLNLIINFNMLTLSTEYLEQHWIMEN